MSKYVYIAFYCTMQINETIPQFLGKATYVTWHLYHEPFNVRNSS